MGTKELAEHHIKQISDYNAMTPEQRSKYHKGKLSRRGRPKSNLTPEQKRERQLAASKAWYAKNREKRRAYSKELWRKKKESRTQPPK